MSNRSGTCRLRASDAQTVHTHYGDLTRKKTLELHRNKILVGTLVRLFYLQTLISYYLLPTIN